MNEIERLLLRLDDGTDRPQPPAVLNKLASPLTTPKIMDNYGSNREATGVRKLPRGDDGHSVFLSQFVQKRDNARDYIFNLAGMNSPWDHKKDIETCLGSQEVVFCERLKERTRSNTAVSINGVSSSTKSKFAQSSREAGIGYPIEKYCSARRDPG